MIPRCATLLRHLALALLLCSTIRSLAETNLPAPNLDRLVRQTRPSLVVLFSVDKRGNARSYGTGFFLAADGTLVTARHVAQAQPNLVAVAHDGTRHPVTTWLGEDADFDLSLLRVDGYSPRAHLKLAGKALPQTNQWLALVSAKDTIASSCSTGLVTAVMSYPGLLAAVTTTVPVRAGQSGSPLLNLAGEVVGVVPYMSFEDTVTASPISALQALWERARTNPPVAFAKRPRNGNREPLMFDPDFRLGVDALSRKDLKEAEVRMRSAVKNFPASPLAFTMLAAIQTQRAEFKKANATIQKALSLNPDSALPHLLNGLCLIQDNHLPEGLLAVRKSLELGLPDSDTLTSAWVLLVSGERAMGNRDKAHAALEHLRQIDPARADALQRELPALPSE